MNEYRSEEIAYRTWVEFYYLTKFKNDDEYVLSLINKMNELNSKYNVTEFISNRAKKEVKDYKNTVLRSMYLLYEGDYFLEEKHE